MESTFGSRLRELRRRAGVLQKDVAKAAGVATSSYALYENDRRRPNQAITEKICEYLRCDANYLYGYSAYPNQNEAMKDKVQSIMLFDMDSLKGGNINVTQSTGTFSIPRGLLSPSQFCFGVQVSDDSMLGCSLRRGDYAIFCLEAASANEKACLVTLNGTPMIRICELDEQENVKALIPMNDAYKPIKIKKTDDVKVVGRLAVIISVKS